MMSGLVHRKTSEWHSCRSPDGHSTREGHVFSVELASSLYCSCPKIQSPSISAYLLTRTGVAPSVHVLQPCSGEESGPSSLSEETRDFLVYLYGKSHIKNANFVIHYVNEIKDFMQISLICINRTRLLYIKAASSSLGHFSVSKRQHQNDHLNEPLLDTLHRVQDGCALHGR